MHHTRWLAGAFLAVTALAQAPPANTPKYDNLNAVLWVQRSVEYAAVATEVYRTAERTLPRAIDDKHWTAALEQTQRFEDFPPAVILDLDETVLDNSALEARLTATGEPYSDRAWDEWVAQMRAGALPAAVRFLNKAALSGVTPIYITNRVCHPNDPADPTVGGLRRLRIPVSPEHVYCRSKNGESLDKSGRRAIVAHSYRILMLFGDDITDFTWIDPKTPSEERIKLLTNYDGLLGERWFVLPNPMYGSWEQAIGMDVESRVKALRR